MMMNSSYYITNIITINYNKDTIKGAFYNNFDQNFNVKPLAAWAGFENYRYRLVSNRLKKRPLFLLLEEILFKKFYLRNYQESSSCVRNIINNISID